MSNVRIERIVERQMRNWELARSQCESTPSAAAPPVRAFVAISRAHSSGGLTLARRLGERIGWDVYDQEILNLMARYDTVQQRVYELADEHPEGHLETILKNLSLEGRPPDADYFSRLVSAIHTIARANHAIFVGRGAGFALGRRADLRFRIIAPDPQRWERYAADHGCTIDQAATAVRRLDADRSRFVQAHFGIDPAAPEHYDAIINLGTLSPEAAVDMIIAAIEHRTDLDPAPAG